MTVFTMVTEAFRANALPFSVTIVTLPAVENVVAAEEMMEAHYIIHNFLNETRINMRLYDLPPRTRGI